MMISIRVVRRMEDTNLVGDLFAVCQDEGGEQSFVVEMLEVFAL